MSDSLMWYAIRVKYGKEKSVAAVLCTEDLGDFVEEVLLPVEHVLDIKDGVRIEVERLFFSGYVYVCSKTRSAVLASKLSKLPGVIRFSSGEVVSVLFDEEIEEIKGRMRQSEDKPKMAVSFSIGERVKISHGVFASFTGYVQSIDHEKYKMVVSIPVFGGVRQIELDQADVEKV